MTKVKNVFLFAIVSMFLASCTLQPGTLPADTTNSGVFQEQDLRDFADNWLRITSYQHSPGHVNILGRGLVHMTGRYRFEGDPRTGGTTELGQIDLEINFADRDEVRPRSYVIPIVSGKLSNVTGLLPGEPDFGVGWSGEIPLTGTVSVEEPIGTEEIPPVIGFEVREGTLTSIPRRAGEAGTLRVVTRIFSGTFSQEFDLGLFPLSAAGTVKQDDTARVNPNNQFYLEEIR